MRGILMGAALVCACAGQNYTVTARATSPTPVQDVFDCLRAHLQPLGFKQSALDVDAHRVVTQRFDESKRRPDVLFRRMVDVLEFEVHPDTGGQTAILLQSKTFAEYMNQRGQTL